MDGKTLEPGSDNNHQLNSFTIDSSAAKNSVSDKFSGKWFRLELMLNLVNHMLIGFITIFLCYKCAVVDNAGAKHALICTIGFVTLMAEGVMTHYNGNVALFLYTRKTKTTVHWILQALGGTIGLAGGIYIIDYKTAHFVTIHGQFGLAAMILCAISMISGLSALYSQTLRRILQPLLNKTAHNFLGIATFVVAMIAQYYGLFWLWETEAPLRLLIQVVTLFVLVLCCWGPLKALLDKSKNIYENV